MRPLVFALAAIAAVILAPAAALAAPIAIGPPVGTKAPALVATDAAGRPAALADLAGPRGLVLVFVRSARWCPFCQTQLIDLREAQGALKAKGYGLAALSYDSPEVLAQFAARRDIDYPLLSDPKSATIDAFGIRDPQYPAGHMAHGVPQPAIFILSRDGVVKASLAEEGYRTRPPTSVVLETVSRLP
ncbi:peroxiredoxin family protein [Phenylobacterium sp.]|jgi:peroxiredoxin|uniref:peroxiredoxin family protein n=1 Tax=Phenylobacterium sp. TaxID=1871053 RepID=UPI004036371D